MLGLDAQVLLHHWRVIRGRLRRRGHAESVTKAGRQDYGQGLEISHQKSHRIISWLGAERSVTVGEGVS
jgi:hypothetical protein